MAGFDDAGEDVEERADRVLLQELAALPVSHVGDVGDERQERHQLLLPVGVHGAKNLRPVRPRFVQVLTSRQVTVFVQPDVVALGEVPEETAGVVDLLRQVHQDVRYALKAGYHPGYVLRGVRYDMADGGQDRRMMGGLGGRVLYLRAAHGGDDTGVHVGVRHRLASLVDAGHVLMVQLRPLRRGYAGGGELVGAGTPVVYGGLVGGSHLLRDSYRMVPACACCIAPAAVGWFAAIIAWASCCA